VVDSGTGVRTVQWSRPDIDAEDGFVILTRSRTFVTVVVSASFIDMRGKGGVSNALTPTTRGWSPTMTTGHAQ
jgi:hypothetical protein